jgi:hypothetical protein
MAAAVHFAAIAATLLSLQQARGSKSFLRHPAGDAGSDGLQQQTIPHRLIFTSKTNLLHDTLEDDRRLAENVRNTVAVQSGGVPTAVDFFTDTECEALLAGTEALSRPEERAELVERFRGEAQGRYRGDMCRAAALYRTGGLYLDVDLVSRRSVWPLIGGSSFVTVRERESDCFFQAFIGATPRHPLLAKYLAFTLEYYRGERGLSPGCAHIGPSLLRQARDALPDIDVQLLQERRISQDFRAWWTTPLQPGVQCDLDDYVVVEPTSGAVPFYSRLSGVNYCYARGAHFGWGDFLLLVLMGGCALLAAALAARRYFLRKRRNQDGVPRRL